MRIRLILTCMRNIWKRDILACLDLIIGERNQKYLELKKREETMQGMKSTLYQPMLLYQFPRLLNS